MSQISRLLLLLLLLYHPVFSQSKNIETIAFYNVENLFDPLDDPETFDDDYTPQGRNRWTKNLLNQKIDQLAEVITQIGKKETGKPPLLIGLAEVENRAVLEQLVAHPKVRPYGYEIVHFDSPDSRGIDVALLYRKLFFLPRTLKKYKLHLVDPQTLYRRTTRDQLIVSGFWEEAELSIGVNHWPSRRGGQKRSQTSRIKAAQLQLKILDSLQRAIPAAYFLSMGDFNDNPNDTSVALLSEESTFYEGYQPLYNPMKKLFQKGIGSLAHRDRWHLFDQILVSQNWISKGGLNLLKAAVFNPGFLINSEGKFLGYPYRNEMKGGTLAGYSDHFPVYLIVSKE